MISAHLHFTQEAEAEQLYTAENRQHGEQQQGPVADISAQQQLLSHEPEAGDESKPQAEQPHESEAMHRAGEETLHEPHREQIHQHPEGAVDAVLALAVAAGVMVHLHLADPGSLDEGQGGQKAVQLAVEVHVTHQFPPVGLEGTAVIVKLHPGDPADQLVGQQRGQQAAHGRILPLVPPAAHQIEVAVLKALQKEGNIGRIVLEVAVEGHDHRSAAGVETGRHGGGLAVIAAQQHSHQFGNPASQIAQQGRGAVAGAIVHQHHFKAERQGPQGRQHLLNQVGQAAFFVVEGHHHREIQRAGER